MSLQAIVLPKKPRSGSSSFISGVSFVFLYFLSLPCTIASSTSVFPVIVISSPLNVSVTSEMDVLTFWSAIVHLIALKIYVCFLFVFFLNSAAKVVLFAAALALASCSYL